jgi:6-phospho-beta-glucosidase
MKISIIGGGGVRTPLLVSGLMQSDLPIDEIALFDTDQDRLSLIAPLAALLAPAVRSYADPAACVSRSSFVFLTVRAGGMAARAHDEAAAVAHGIAGQETVGPAGFAMAMRNAPAATEYARLVAHVAPHAWIINFTNPVSIVTQAMERAGCGRVIGICDTPAELFADVAHVLDVEPSRCFFDYFGLNHLGWLREVFCDGEPQLWRVWDDPRLLSRVYRAHLFDQHLLRWLRLLPTEYLYFYYSPAKALDNIRNAGQTRGSAIAQLNERLFHELAAPGADRRRVYEHYLEQRNASYMQIESGSAQPLARPPWADLTGYDKIALDVVRAIHFNTNTILPLNVVNRGSIRDLDNEDVVEVPCVVNAGGARPLTVGPVPEVVRDLLVHVKQYERSTVTAASTASFDDAVAALAANPLVGDRMLAHRLVAVLQTEGAAASQGG